MTSQNKVGTYLILLSSPTEWEGTKERVPGRLVRRMNRILRFCQPVRSGKASIPPPESVAAFQVFIEPVERSPYRVDLVFTLFEAVAFVGVIVDIHVLPIFLEEFDNLIGLLLGTGGSLLPCSTRRGAFTLWIYVIGEAAWESGCQVSTRKM